MRVLDPKSEKHVDIDRRKNMLESITLEELNEAEAFIHSLFPATPMLSLELNGCSINECQLKLETTTPTGSFKIRGASYYLHKLSTLNKNLNNFVTASTGNHGIGLAWAAKALKKKITVVVPTKISQYKYNKLLSLGADVLIYGETLDESIVWARNELCKEPAEFIPSFSPNIILGHSTMGTEIFRANIFLSHIFFPIGVGSGMSGLALSRDLLSPSTKLIGVVPAVSDAWKRSFEKKEAISAHPTASIADGLLTERPDQGMLNFLFPRLDKVLSVTEKEIHDAKKLCLDRMNIVAEGAGVVGLAGVIQYSKNLCEENVKVGTVICG